MDSNFLQHIWQPTFKWWNTFRGNYAGIGYEWDEDNQIFWPKKPYASWVKILQLHAWQSPIGDAPALTAEQNSHNMKASTHKDGAMIGMNQSSLGT